MTSEKEPKTQKIEIRITPTLKKKVRAQAQAEGVTISRYIQRLLETHVKR
jgi:predicted DNA binding CopG/RHH family protein